MEEIADGFLSFRDLDRITAATLRRDLDRLEEQGKLKRVRGGARLVEAEHVSLSDVPIHENVGRNHPQKQAIGRPGMFAVETYAAVRRFVFVEGKSTRDSIDPARSQSSPLVPAQK